jgi:uncharacterized membrane protein
MKKLFVGLLGAALLAVAGCHPGTTGGPGTPGGKGSVLGGLAENTFKLDTPTLSTKIKQGETKDVTISIDRGKNFDQDVTLKFEDLPAGVKIEPAGTVIKHGDKEAKVTVHAADDAAVGDFTVQAVGQPAKGETASSKLKITVEKK